MGFSSSIVVIQFLLETIILCSIGGILGSLMGAVAGIMISKIILPTGIFSWQGLALGLGSSFLAGVVFGLVPAIKASQVDPVKTMQS